MFIKNIVFSALAVATFGTAAMAQTNQPNPPREMDGRPGGRMERGMRDGGGNRGFGKMDGGRRRGGWMNFENLNLTDAQKQRIQTIHTNARNAREANRAQFEELNNLLRFRREGLLTAEQETRLTALQAQRLTQMRTETERVQNEILAVLTPDQRTLLEQYRNAPMRGRMMNPGQMNPRSIPPAPQNN